MKRALRPSPEQRYQNIKRVGYYRGHENACNNSLEKCVPTCRFFPDEGRIEDSHTVVVDDDSSTAAMTITNPLLTQKVVESE